MRILQLNCWVLLFLSTLVVSTWADYHIGYLIQEDSVLFESPNNTLADGSCCDSSCTDQSCCSSSVVTCSPSLRLCFRDPGHPEEDTESLCPLLQIERNNLGFDIAQASLTDVIEEFYTGSFQIYVRISHKVNPSAPDFDPPFTDPLIDNIFIEVNVPAVPFIMIPPPVTTGTVPGDFNRASISFSVSVICAENFNGTDCSTRCLEDENGILTCERVNDGPPVRATETRPTTVTAGTVSTGGVVEEDSTNVVGIAVGVTLGVLAIIVIIIIVIVVAMLLVRKRKIGKWNPQTLNYTLRPKSQTPSINGNDDLSPGDSANQQDPLNVSEMYATVNKSKQSNEGEGGTDQDNNTDDEEPPPIPAYNPDSYEPAKLEEGVVYENVSASRANNDKGSPSTIQDAAEDQERDM